MTSDEHPLVALARSAITLYIRESRVLPATGDLRELGEIKAGAFVSLHRNEQLRGCIGTISNVYGNLEREVIHNAISAATRDPRFMPLQASELDDLAISVDVLGQPERVAGLEDLDPRQYGVIVERGNRRGLLLPDLEGVDTAQQQVEIALRKAGIGAYQSYTLSRFRVDRYH
ncbi:MAG: AmmeMemoRadiSam system protein A [Anaerolineae bacterium]|jgi:AmmeMemoRadiSam system protein A|nr:AmmeMemoRadiSam system protein A [Chloroflexota bacterium]